MVGGAGGRVILSIDPGDRPGFAVFAPGSGWYSTTKWADVARIDPGGITHVVVEGQHPDPKSSRQSLLTLSFGAGFRAGFASAYFRAPVYGATAAMWRGNLDPLWTDLPKAVFLNRALDRYSAALPNPSGLSTDELDAILLAYSFSVSQDAFLQVDVETPRLTTTARTRSKRTSSRRRKATR